ncbi:hypothetical protein AKJ39_04345 [candidate division MSBL1 archaeon SCGC-AAA259J03]|uniref:Ribbon-helix-helix protein CopG domain-containing protein n=1 Tax=candidate division MSBL1 archaeon SCGC-AAA259J03 TaxID=1698269 RepID=A0A656YWX1_9EURY|nr:hypothetical protein AKJ39_04345 [candidate division MSBL1 archaeon SCGC-AAA259J03]
MSITEAYSEKHKVENLEKDLGSPLLTSEKSWVEVVPFYISGFSVKIPQCLIGIIITIRIVMSTTITVKKTTREKLEKLKKRKKATSFDQLLRKIADEKLEIHDSLFGKAKGIRKNFEREHEERV